MGFVLELLFKVVFRVIFCWTGEIILFILTLGKHKPRWDLHTQESPIRFIFFYNFSIWIGMIFSFAILVLIIKLVIWK